MTRRSVRALFLQLALGTCALWVAQPARPAFAQSTSTYVIQGGRANPPETALSGARLDSLVAPIALYPDPLLSQVLVASTYPLEIVEAAQWLHANPGLSGVALQEAARQQDWDPSIQALMVFPDVLYRLSDNIKWTTDLGNAFLAQESGVMDAVQQMRRQALSSGKLGSNAQTTVTTESHGTTIIVEIRPANPQMIYVPVYDPLAVWGPVNFYPYPALRLTRGPFVTAALPLSFTSGVFIGAFFPGWSGWNGWGWRPNWSGRSIVVNNNFFHQYGYNRYDWYDRNGPDRVVSARAIRPNDIVIWRHNPVHRVNVPYSNREIATRFRNDYRERIPNRVPQAASRSSIPVQAQRPPRPPDITGRVPVVVQRESRPARGIVTPQAPGASRPTNASRGSAAPAGTSQRPNVRGTPAPGNQRGAQERGRSAAPQPPRGRGGRTR